MAGKRAQWSEEDLRSALQNIVNGMSRSTLGLHYRTQNHKTNLEGPQYCLHQKKMTLSEEFKDYLCLEYL